MNGLQTDFDLHRGTPTAPKAKNEHPAHRHKVFAVFDFYTGILARQAVGVQIKLNYTLTQPRMNLGEFSAREILARQAVGVQIKLN